MKRNKTSKSVCIILLLSFTMASCKEYEKRKILAHQEALEEINQEKWEEELEYLNARIEQQEKQAISEGESTSRGQQKIIERDSSFIISKNNSLGYKYKILGKKKVTLDNHHSEMNGKYMLYKEAKKLNAEAIISYKVDYSHSDFFTVEGTFIKRE